MLDIKVILPLHKYDETVKPLLTRAIESFRKNGYPDDSFVIVSDANVSEKVKNDKDLKLTNNFILAPEGLSTKLPSLINYAVKNIKSKYFMVLEYDDYLTEFWIKKAEEYIESETFNSSVYMPLTEITDFQNPEGGTIGYANEAPWASSFSDEIGFIDFECLQNYMEFCTSGAIFKKDDFEECGGLKESMELTYWYELLLRMTNLGKRVFVVPKAGYVHTVNRPGSIISEYSKNMTEDEINWWTDLAKKEYFFKTDRNKKYEEE